MAASMAAQMRNCKSPLLQIGRHRRITGFFFRRISEIARESEIVASVDNPKSVPVRVAHELLRSGHRYLDVRTVEEFREGHVPSATNIPYMFKFGSGMTKNPEFLEEMTACFGKDEHILVGCRSGKRSLMAASDLLSASYTNITDIAGGYTAWVQNGLPTKS